METREEAYSENMHLEHWKGEYTPNRTGCKDYIIQGNWGGGSTGKQDVMCISFDVNVAKLKCH